ncbi:MAG: hypothetical protein Q4C82_00385 [Eubacteriales bacterium]|nr:hypothetical protein [Eubacteriales bacterium]
MKNHCAALLLGASLLAVSGCGAQAGLAEKMAQAAEEAEETDTEQTGDAAEPEEADAEQAGNAAGTEEDAGSGTDGTEEASAPPVSLSGAAAGAYRSVLEDIFYEHRFPDGQDYGFEYGGDVTTNKFAVCDADQDGRQELVIFYQTTTMAGKRFLIYDFDEEQDAVREEFSEFPSVTFYENGYVKAKLSHNHGLAPYGDFWPYTLYRYDAEGDTYTVTASVDAWEKEWSETDYQGNPFPEEADTSGAGIVYYATPEGEEDTAPMDQSVYEEWVADWMGDARIMEFPFEYLTEENIKKINQT